MTGVGNDSAGLCSIDDVAMTVTVIIPCFNAERWIGETLRSLLAQPAQPAEIIVVDDGSTDSSREIVATFVPTVRLITQSNLGACHARNVGLDETKSPAVMFLDADDYLEGDFIGGAGRVLARAGADIAFAPVVLVRPSGISRRVFHFCRVPTVQALFGGWLTHFSQPPCSIVWRTSFVRDIGGWDERVLKNQDGEIAMRAMLYTPVICSFADGHGVYREHGEPSISRQLNPDALRSELNAMISLVRAAKGTVFEPEITGFGLKFYVIARGAYQIGENILAREALDNAREVGLKGHPGSLGHRFVASIFGLRVKMQIAKLWHRRK